MAMATKVLVTGRKKIDLVDMAQPAPRLDQQREPQAEPTAAGTTIADIGRGVHQGAGGCVVAQEPA